MLPPHYWRHIFMKLFRLAAAPLVLLLFVSGCTGLGGSIDLGNELHVRLSDKPSPGAREQKYPVTVRIAPYKDGRSGVEPRQVGVSTARIMGLTGKQIVLDQEAVILVGDVMRKQLGDAGLQMLGAGAKNAQFQLSGSIKTLSVEIRERDYLHIVIESTLTEVASGQVIWSGVVAEKQERYAGSSGNTKGDVANFLRNGLQVVADKTGESLLSVLMSTRPELFGLNAAVKPVSGVTVNAVAVPMVSAPPVPAVAAVNSLQGALLLSSVPSRAKVYVNDVYYGLTPLRLDLTPGIYPVRIELEGYKSVAEKVSVRSEDHTELEMKLRK